MSKPKTIHPDALKFYRKVYIYYGKEWFPHFAQNLNFREEYNIIVEVGFGGLWLRDAGYAEYEMLNYPVLVRFTDKFAEEVIEEDGEYE